jgi:methyl-accepting chemotaxis protein
VRSQLRIVFAIVIAISFISTALAIWQLGVLSSDTHELTERPLAKERLLSNWLLNTSVGAERTKGIARSADPSLATAFADAARQTSASNAKLQKTIGEMLDSPEEKALYAQIGEKRKRFLAARDEVMKLKTEGKSDEASEKFNNVFTPAAEQYIASVNDLLTLQRNSIDSRAQGLLENAGSSRTMLVAMAIATLLFSIGAGVVFARSLFRRLGGEPAAAAAVAREIAAGNLAVEIPVDERHAGSLMAALRAMRDSLAGLVGNVRHSTATINESAQVLSSEAEDLSRRTESQAAALEETASSMAELTHAVNENAGNAEQASRLAAQASRVAREGGSMVGQLVATMGTINESSRQIVDIIGVIDGIAFQTNILSLNAAVEAARAGEQGRGFAVVAAEVRALAQRSAAAAKEIKALITDSTVRVEDGAALAQQAGATMTDIVGGIERVAAIMAEIVESGREQASGIQQVNQAVAQMDGMTQQNAGLVEETVAATGAVREQAANLSQLVGVFRLSGTPQASARPRRVKPTHLLPAQA